MTYSRDANEIAREYARAHVEQDSSTRVSTWKQQPAPRGTLSVYESLRAAHNGTSPLTVSRNVILQLDRPGVVLAYDPEGFVEIFSASDGLYMTFEPDRAGE